MEVFMTRWFCWRLLLLGFSTFFSYLLKGTVVIEHISCLAVQLYKSKPAMITFKHSSCLPDRVIINRLQQWITWCQIWLHFLQHDTDFKNFSLKVFQNPADGVRSVLWFGPAWGVRRDRSSPMFKWFFPGSILFSREVKGPSGLRLGNHLSSSRVLQRRPV